MTGFRDEDERPRRIDGARAPRPGIGAPLPYAEARAQDDVARRRREAVDALVLRTLRLPLRDRRGSADFVDIGLNEHIGRTAGHAVPVVGVTAANASTSGDLPWMSVHENGPASDDKVEALRAIVDQASSAISSGRSGIGDPGGRLPRPFDREEPWFERYLRMAGRSGAAAVPPAYSLPILPLGALAGAATGAAGASRNRSRQDMPHRLAHEPLPIRRRP